MQLNAPTKVVFVLSCVLAVLALVASFVTIPFVSANAFWVLFVAFVLLVAGNVFKGF